MNLFSKKKKETKLQEIKNLSISELLSTPKDTFLKILSQKGEGKKGSPRKRLPLLKPTGNKWNSWVESISKDGRGDIWFWIYVQYSNTDTTRLISMNDFLRHGDFSGTIEYQDRNGDHQTYRYYYSPEDKAEVIREIFRSYIG